MNRISAAIVGCIALFALQANAQELTVYAGYLNPGSLNLQTIREDLDFRGTSIFGVRFGVDFARVIGIEQDFAFSSRLFESTLIPGDDDVRGFLYSSNLVVNLPLDRFVPYATAGVGLMKPFGSGFKPFDVKFAGNYGGGIKFKRLIGPLGLRFDVRGYSIPGIASQTLNLVEVSGGIMFSSR